MTFKTFVDWSFSMSPTCTQLAEWADSGPGTSRPCRVFIESVLTTSIRHRMWPGEGSTAQWKWSPPSPGSLKALLFPLWEWRGHRPHLVGPAHGIGSKPKKLAFSLLQIDMASWMQSWRPSKGTWKDNSHEAMENLMQSLQRLYSF